MSRSEKRPSQTRKGGQRRSHASSHSKKDFVPNMQRDFKIEIVELSALKPHPQNYRTHPEDQISHLTQSVKQHGLYRNVVIAKDDTILAGHGIITAAAKMGLSKIPVIRLNVNSSDPNALRVLVGDNTSSHLAEDNDRLLTDLLKQIKESSEGLLGTGYDEMMLANMIMVTRPQSEIADFNEAAQWIGMPEYQEGGDKIQLIITFLSENDRQRFEKETGIRIMAKKKTWETRWPWRERDDKASIRYQKDRPNGRAKNIDRAFAS